MGEPGSEVAVAAAPTPAVLGPVQRDEWMTIVEQATTIANTKIVPSVFRGKPDEVIAVSLLARDVGRGLMWGLRYVYISPEGKTAMYAEGMISLVRAAGYDIWPIETTDRNAKVGWVRGARSGEIEYTLAQAVKAGLCTLNDDGSARSRSQNGKPLPWETYTEDLLWARVISRTCRRVYSDIIGGMSYVPEEIGARVDPETGEVTAPDVTTITAEKARELRARIGDLSPEMKKALKARFGEMGAVIASGKDTTESPLVPLLPQSWLERIELEIAGVEQWEPKKDEAPVDDDEVVEGELVGGEPDGPIPMEESAPAPLRIVQNDPKHAGRVVRDDKPLDFNWHYLVEGADEIPVCNECTHQCAEHVHAGASGGCTRCACSITEWTVAEGPGSPVDQSGVTAPAAVAVNDGPESVEGAGPTPPESAGTDTTPPAGASATGPSPTETPTSDGDGPGPIPNPLTESQFRGIHAAMRDNKLGDDERHVIIAFVTGSRTTSSKEITGDEATIVLNLLGKVKSQALSVGVHDGQMAVFAMNELGVKFLNSIERKLIPAAGKGGGQRAKTGTVEKVGVGPDGYPEDSF